jgi:Flp pilus assembly protein TadD
MLHESVSFDSVIKNPSLWARVDQSILEQHAVNLCLLCASHQSPGDLLLASFDAMYRRLLEDLSPVERGSIIDEVCASLPVGVAAVQTLALFVHAEPDPGVAATAVINMAHLAPLSGDDPLSGLSLLTSLYEREHTSETVRASIFCGLLLLGDRRVLPLLDRLWGLLGPQGRRRVLFATSGVAYASTVDFLLHRLGKERDDGLFGSLAAALYRLPEETAQGPRPGYIVDVERRFPSSFLQSEPTLRLLGEWPIEEYAARIAPRLRELAREESEPKVLPTVMAAWGIDPDGVHRPTGTNMALGELRRFEEAVLSYDKALGLDPNDAWGWFQRGLALGELERFEEAIVSYDKALELDPEDAAAWYNRGIALDEMGRYEEAVLSYDKALELDPELKAVRFQRGCALADLGRDAEVFASYDEALARDPRDAGWG